MTGLGPSAQADRDDTRAARPAGPRAASTTATTMTTPRSIQRRIRKPSYEGTARFSSGSGARCCVSDRVLNASGPNSKSRRPCSSQVCVFVRLAHEDADTLPRLPQRRGDETIIEIFGNDHCNLIRLTRFTSFWNLAATPGR